MSLARNQKLALAAVAVMIALVVGYGYIRNGGANAGSDEVVFSDVGAGASDGAFPAFGKVICHVAGGVKKPGVYTLAAGSRVFQAIKAAGGQTEDANVDTLNLAAPIEDGSKIVVPTRNATGAPGDDPSAAYSQGYSPAPTYSGSGTATSASRRSRSGGSSNKLKVPGEGTVNINTAGASELTRLPGVGPSTAQKIIDYRNQIGRFAAPEQLMDVKGIGPKKLAKMRPFVVCN